ncbi:MAG: hypothetical protein LBR16_00440 [Treponema sp.]|jgi:hypothetical protein|nr:hypothetical protein [Treponema sp.]
MNSIFALQGRMNCGKSQTLRLVCDMLQQRPGVQVVRTFFSNPTDRQVILSINGHKVGIVTMGDPPPYLSILQKALDAFEKEVCVIIFCACRTRGKTVNCIKKHKQYQLQFIQQQCLPPGHTPKEEEASNRRMAEHLIQIKEYLRGMPDSGKSLTDLHKAFDPGCSGDAET